MKLWLGTHKTDLGVVTRAAASSDLNLREKLSKLATEGFRDSPNDEPILITGTWDITKAEVASDQAGIFALVEGRESAIRTEADFSATYTVDAAGEVTKQRAKK